MFLLYLGVALLLSWFGAGGLLIYLAFFPIAILGQITACVEFQCPCIDGFGPCVGGFGIPARWLFQVGITTAEIAFFGIILYPVYFLFQAGTGYLIGYLVIVLFYAGVFLTRICPMCAIQEKCPGRQTSTALLQIFIPEELNDVSKTTENPPEAFPPHHGPDLCRTGCRLDPVDLHRRRSVGRISTAAADLAPVVLDAGRLFPDLDRPDPGLEMGAAQMNSHPGRNAVILPAGFHQIGRASCRERV
jgi:hypothetical protein